MLDTHTFQKTIRTVFITACILMLFSTSHTAVRVINGVAVPGDFPHIETNVLGETAPGRIFISTSFPIGRPNSYIIILENDGTPYFYRRFPNSANSVGTGDFKVQPNGMLSYHKYIHNEDGYWVTLDRHFAEVDTFRCVNRDRTDSHEFVLLENGHALLVCDYDSTTDMSQIVSEGRPNARVIHMLPQEVDAEGNLYWEWKVWEHLDITDSYVSLRDQTIDYIHLNSIAVDYDGNLILSLNRFNEVCKIDPETGDFIWRLGGKNNEFTFINENTMIASQHHVRPVEGHPDHYTIYDNNGADVSRAVEYAINTNVDPPTAEKVWEVRDTQNNYMMGSVQRLDNGHTYIDWSDNPPLRACEVDADNNEVFEITVNDISGYRSFRFDWDGTMQKPYLLAESQPEAVVLIFNKFGDPDVKEYRVVGGKTPDAMEPVTTTSETYAELTDLDNGSRYYFRVCAVDHSDRRSDYSDVVEVNVQYSEPGANLIVNGDFSGGTSGWHIVNQGGGQGSGSVSDGEYHIHISDGGTEYWHVQLIQESFPLIQGRDYLFAFDAYADAGRIIEPRVAQNGGNYTNYSRTSPIYINPQKQRYSFEFEMTDPSDDQARLVLNCGTSPITCHFDNIIVAEKVESDIVDDEDPSIQPDQFQVLQNYPNPFNASTSIRFYLPEPGQLKASVYDITGKRASDIMDSSRKAGWHTLHFNGSNLSSGGYFCRITGRTDTGNRSFSRTQKWILIK